MSARLTLVRDGDATVAVVWDNLSSDQFAAVEPVSVREAFGCPVVIVQGEVDVRVVVQPLAADAETLRTAAEYAEDHAQWQADRKAWLDTLPTPVTESTGLG